MKLSIRKFISRDNIIGRIGARRAGIETRRQLVRKICKCWFGNERLKNELQKPSMHIGDRNRVSRLCLGFATLLAERKEQF